MTTTEAPRRRQLLDLDTLVPERAWIRIDGKPYDLRASTDFGLVGQVKVSRIMERLAPLQARLAADPDSASDDDVAETVRLLHDITDLVVDAPPEVLARLSDVQCQQVVSAFTRASETRSPTPAPNRASRRTGASSSPVSRRPTAPRTGS